MIRYYDICPFYLLEHVFPDPASPKSPHQKFMHHGYMHQWPSVWVTRHERPKATKEDVKQACRAQRRAEGPQAKESGPNRSQNF